MKLTLIIISFLAASCASVRTYTACGNIPDRKLLEPIGSGIAALKGSDENGEVIEGIQITVNTESAVAFFEYVSELEKYAKRAHEKCVETPK